MYLHVRLNPQGGASLYIYCTTTLYVYLQGRLNSSEPAKRCASTCIHIHNIQQVCVLQLYIYEKLFAIAIIKYIWNFHPPSPQCELINNKPFFFFFEKKYQASHVVCSFANREERERKVYGSPAALPRCAKAKGKSASDSSSSRSLSLSRTWYSGSCPRWYILAKVPLGRRIRSPLAPRARLLLLYVCVCVLLDHRWSKRCGIGIPPMQHIPPRLIYQYKKKLLIYCTYI